MEQNKQEIKDDVFIYLWVNKQWGNSFINNGDFINLPISYTSEIFSFLGLDSGFIRKEQAVTLYSKLEESFINKIKVFTSNRGASTYRC